MGNQPYQLFAKKRKVALPPSYHLSSQVSSPGFNTLNVQLGWPEFNTMLYLSVQYNESGESVKQKPNAPMTTQDLGASASRQYRSAQ
jgi:hypothetical protein